MSNYYYLMAQLPAVQPGLPLAFSYEQFQEIALRFLSAKDAKILQSLSLEPPRTKKKTGSSFVDAWYEKERILRLVLEEKRAEKLKREKILSYNEQALIHFVPEEEQVAKHALSLENPLEAELYLNSFRWATIDTLRGQHFFDSVAVFAYGLMVLLQERNNQFTTEAGNASYTNIYNQILENKA